MEFFEKNESVVGALLNVWNISYVAMNLPKPQWYQDSNVIDINIGLKKSVKFVMSDKDLTKELQEEYDRKNEHLQHLKNLLASVSLSCPSPELLEKKREQIKLLQSELEDLEYKIWQLKINNK